MGILTLAGNTGSKIVFDSNGDARKTLAENRGMCIMRIVF